MRILFVHPDLGVGGAERLIVDTAQAAQANGHSVTILTNQFDEKHCFEDALSLHIVTAFSFLPRQVCGRFHAFFAYLKICLASIWFLIYSHQPYDIVYIDQISMPVAIFKSFTKYKVIFYCHYPDQLLCVARNSFLKRIYRTPIDSIELKTTGMADLILVNSEFTKKTFRTTFPSLDDKELKVLYPSLNTEIFDGLLNKFIENKNEEKQHKSKYDEANRLEYIKSREKKFVFLSINRYERKKDLKLGLFTFLFSFFVLIIKKINKLSLFKKQSKRWLN
jgi:alpha-1,3/alpha-1,6-mannosyltransferase